MPRGEQVRGLCANRDARSAVMARLRSTSLMPSDWLPECRRCAAKNPALASDLERRATAWIEEHGSSFPGDVETGLIGDSEEDRERFEDYANEPACPALNPVTGLCDVYEWRPMTCRVFGPPVRMDTGNSLGYCELCFHGATTEEVEACEMQIPRDLEQELADQLPANGETIVAFALLR